MLGLLITIISRGHLFDLILVRNDLIAEVQVVSNFDIKVQCSGTMGGQRIMFVTKSCFCSCLLVFLKCKSGTNRPPTFGKTQKTKFQRRCIGVHGHSSLKCLIMVENERKIGPGTLVCTRFAITNFL